MILFDSANLLIAKIKSLFDRDLALQNDYLDNWGRPLHFYIYRISDVCYQGPCPDKPE